MKKKEVVVVMRMKFCKEAEDIQRLLPADARAKDDFLEEASRKRQERHSGVSSCLENSIHLIGWRGTTGAWHAVHMLLGET
jgi:hypothetical protein